MADEGRDDKLRAQIASGFYYSEFQPPASPPIPQLESQMHGFETSPELFGLQSGMEMLGLPWKNLHQRGKSYSSDFLPKLSSVNPESSSNAGANAAADYYQKPEFSIGLPAPDTDPNHVAAAEQHSSWPENRLVAVDEASFPGGFPPDGRNHCLSLSLSPNQACGAQSGDYRLVSPDSGDGFRSYPSMIAFSPHQAMPQQRQLKNSKYLLPTQELLNEFCSLQATKLQNDSKTTGGYSRNKFEKPNQWEGGASSMHQQSLCSLDYLELQKRNAKLNSLLEELDMRYRKYCEQMRGVVTWFEAVAGAGSAGVYSSLALKAISRHFRCLRDGIWGQIQATKKAMGEKDVVAPGTTRGETPRLKLLDQTLRQQRALQQMGMMESHPWRPQRGLPERSVSMLRAWLFEHFLHPYPSDVDKHILARQTGLSRSQVSNWFINARVRLWKPMVEEMYVEETKGEENKASNGTATSQNPNPNPGNGIHPDQKHSLQQLVHDPESLSSIINGSEKPDQKDQLASGQFTAAENFGAIDLDFSNYSSLQASTITYGSGGDTNPNFGSGVSLTLGLQQHNGAGVNVSFSPASQQSLFFPRQHMEDCQQVQYSMLDGTETQNLPYRNLMEAQLLHDLTG